MARNLSISSSKKIPKAFLLALSIVVIVHFVELFILPINFFTFRLWEALSVRNLSSVLSGTFYPNMKISMLEEGGLGHGSRFAVKKKVEWETDRYGHRNRNRDIAKYNIVIVGDSNIVGSSLTQDDMLAEVLEKRIGLITYTLGKGAFPPINGFLSSKRFIDAPPDIVIVGVAEEWILKLPRLNMQSKSLKKPSLIEQSLRKSPTLAVLLDRLSKQIIYHYIAGRIRQVKNKVAGKSDFFAIDPAPNNLSQGAQILLRTEVVPDISLEERRKIVNIIKSYDTILKQRDIRFIFLPIPKKEHIYYEYLPVKKNPVFLSRLISDLQDLIIEVIDTQEHFRQAYKAKETLLYQSDDSHLSPEGVRLLADLIENHLR